jgi:predicted 3-demethylubiquinone-9 3-methyltransferase (glyoxalase superfamily)
MQKITPFLWFNGNAEEAMKFYVSVFKNSRVGNVVRYSAGGPGPEGSVMSVTFQLEGQDFIGLNGGPNFSFTPAISLFVDCKTQDEVDHLWEQLSEGGVKEKCGWLKDKFGLSWQIIPSALGQMMHTSDGKTSEAVMKAMMKMDKIDIKTLETAATQQAGWQPA